MRVPLIKILILAFGICAFEKAHSVISPEGVADWMWNWECIRYLRSHIQRHRKTDVLVTSEDRWGLDRIRISGQPRAGVVQRLKRKVYDNATLIRDGQRFRVFFSKPHFTAGRAEAIVQHASRFSKKGDYETWAKVWRVETREEIRYYFRVEDSSNLADAEGCYVDHYMSSALNDLLAVLASE